MKTPITLLLLFVSATSFAQKSDLEQALNEIYFSKNVYEILTTNYVFYVPSGDSAKTALRRYIAKYPENPYRFVAMRYLAQIFEKFHLVDSAALYYKQVLDMPDNIDRYNFHRFTSAFQLTKIYLDRKDYATALNYLELAAGPCFEKSTCGTVRFEDRQRIEALYWTCYFGLGYYKQAIDRYAGLMLNQYWCRPQKLYDAYVKIYSKEEIKKEFLEAANRIEIRKEQYESRINLRPVIKIFDKEVIFYKGGEFEKLTEQEQRQQCMDDFRKSDMYKLATQP